MAEQIAPICEQNGWTSSSYEKELLYVNKMAEQIAPICLWNGWTNSSYNLCEKKKWLNK